MDRFQQILPIFSLVVACAGAAGSDDTIDFETGDFTVRTTVVDDRCLDGGLNLLFMPNGVETPWEWPFPVRIHAERELPITYDIALRQPFGEMTVTASDAGVDLQTLVAEKNEAVLLGEAQFGNCVADMNATVQVRLVAHDEVTGFADLELTDPRGADRCPTDMPPRCSVLLSFEAERR